MSPRILAFSVVLLICLVHQEASAVPPAKPLGAAAFDGFGRLVNCNSSVDCTYQTPCLDGTCYVPKARYVSIRANPLNAGILTARRISLKRPTGNIVLGWIGIPDSSGHAFIGNEDTRPYLDWTDPDLPERVQVGDCHIAPSYTYAIQAIRLGDDINIEANYSDPLELGTTQWGDFAGPIVDGAALPPDCQLNEDDFRAALPGETAAPLQWVDIVPQAPDGVVGFLDLLEAERAAIQGFPYPWENPCQCAGLAEFDAEGLCEPEPVNCVAPATITFSEPGATHLQEIGDFYAGQPPHATVSGGVWYEVEAFGTPDNGSWPVPGWIGDGSFSLVGAGSAPLDEANAIVISFSVELSNVSIRALDVGQAGARVQLFDGDDQLLADDSWVGQTPTGVNEWRYFSFGVSGVRKIKLFQVNAEPDDTVLWQQLQFDAVTSGVIIPTVSHWGILAMVLLVLTIGTLAFARRGVYYSPRIAGSSH